MSNYWVYEATSKQAQLEDIQVELVKSQVENKNLRRFLQAILDEPVEEDPNLVKKQRDRFIKIAETALR